MAKPPNPELARRMLDIALDELGTKPPERVNMRTIAERAGVSATAIYYYFASKEALFERIKLEALDELNARIESAIAAAQGPPLDRLKALISAYVAWSLERPHLAGLLMEELPAQTSLTPESMGSYYSTFTRAQGLVEEAVAEGSLEPRDTELDVSVAQAALWGIISQFRSKRVHPRFWDSIDRLVERFVELFTGKTGGQS